MTETITRTNFFGESEAVRSDTWKEQVRAILNEIDKEGKARAVPPSSTLNQVVYARIIARRATELELWKKLGVSLSAAECERRFVEWHIHADVPSAETAARRVREIEQEAKDATKPQRRGWN